MKRSLILGLVICLFDSLLLAQDLVREFSWKELKESGKLLAGELQPEEAAGRGQPLKIENDSDQPQTVTLLDINDPSVTTLRCSLDGLVRYENVKGKSYLEMWSYFADGGSCFSRTLGDYGPMGHLEGTSDWRQFCLPLISDKKIGPPTRLVMNVVFVDRGTVYLSPLKLVQIRDGWWSEENAGSIGGIGGSIIGIMGAIVGTLGGFGKAQRFVLATMIILVFLGVVCLVAGVFAYFSHQPYEVYYPLLLGGTILTAVFGGNFYTLRHRYRQIELRKMAAMDAQ
jgi:hypothetical protein